VLKCEGSGKPCRNYARQFVKKNGVWHRLCGTHARSFNFMGVEQVLGFVTPPDDNFDEQRMEEMSVYASRSLHCLDRVEPVYPPAGQASPGSLDGPPASLTCSLFARSSNEKEPTASQPGGSHSSRDLQRHYSYAARPQWAYSPGCVRRRLPADAQRRPPPPHPPRLRPTPLPPQRCRGTTRSTPRRSILSPRNPRNAVHTLHTPGGHPHNPGSRSSVSVRRTPPARPGRLWRLGESGMTTWLASTVLGMWSGPAVPGGRLPGPVSCHFLTQVHGCSVSVLRLAARPSWTN